MRSTFKVLIPALAAPAVACAAAASPWVRGGATRAERSRALPGDELLDAATAQVTRAVTIRAAVESVWPWIVQLGTGRAGWCTTDRDSGAKGNQVHADLQHLVRDDRIVDPSGRYELAVWRIDPPWELVLGARLHPPGAGACSLTWAFVLVPTAERRTRLLVRVRFAGDSGVRARAFVRSLELVDAVFTRRMLQGIARRAERPDSPSWPVVADGGATKGWRRVGASGVGSAG
jgi:hypothetical protein